MQIQEIIVRQVAEYRHSNGITLRQQAKDMNVSHTFISRVESRRIQASVEYLHKAIDYLVTKIEKKVVENGR